MTLAVIIAYLALVVAIGTTSQRFLRRTGEDYFVATRSIGPFILLMSAIPLSNPGRVAFHSAGSPS